MDSVKSVIKFWVVDTMPFLASFANFGLRLILVVSVLLNVVTTVAASTLPLTEIQSIQSIAIDSSGNLYVLSEFGSRIRKITPAGEVTTLAGSGLTTPFADGTGTAATFNNARGIAVDSAGNVYVGDRDNHRIRRITPEGVVSTFAGNGTSGSTNATGTNATFASPQGVAVDSAGNVYVAQSNLVRKISPLGVVTTLAGGRTAGALPEYDGTGTNAKIVAITITVDLSGNVYTMNATGSTHTIRKITPAGVVTTFAGTGTAGNVDGTGITSSFNRPYGITNDSSGNLYISQNTTYASLRKLTPTAVTTTLSLRFSEFRRAYNFLNPFGIAIDSSGNLYVADSGNNRICKVDTSGNVTTIAGTSTSANVRNGTSTFNNITKLTCDLIGNVYVSDTNNHRICTITPNGFSSTFAGGPDSGLNGGLGNRYNVRITSPTGIVMGDRIYFLSPSSVVWEIGGVFTSVGFGFRTSVSSRNPTGITMDGSEALYFSDPTNHMIYKKPSVGATSGTDFAGNYSGAFADGSGYSARFNTPNGLTSDTFGNVYVADSGNNRIRKITPAGLVTTLAGNGFAGFADGNGLNSSFNFPCDITIDSGGTLYVADTNNHLIRKIDTSGNVTTLAGNRIGQLTNGIGINTSFSFPRGVALDSWGNLYVADSSNSVIRKITNVLTIPNTTRFTSLVAGNRNFTPFSDGVKAGATFSFPKGIILDKIGNLYVADTSNNRIRKITPAGVVTTLAGNGTAGTTSGLGTNTIFSSPFGLALDSFGNLLIADTGNNRVRRLALNTGVTTDYFGNVAGFDTASLRNPEGLAVDYFGNIFIADTGNHAIRFFNGTQINTIAGTGIAGGITNGIGTSARFWAPRGIAFDSVGNLYVADTNNHCIRKIVISFESDGASSILTSKSVVTTFAGNGNAISVDGIGTNAQFRAPSTIAFDGFGNLYVADTDSDCIRRITPEAVVTTLAGSSRGYPFGSQTNASFNLPYGIAVDPLGKVYVSDTSNNIIRTIEYKSTFTSLNILGIVTTFAGNRTKGIINGTGTNSSFNSLQGITIDSRGTLYVADTNNHLIRRITPAGVVTTFVGSGIDGTTDGTGTNARFSYPVGITIDSGSTLYVAQIGRIRTISSTGVVTTLTTDVSYPSGIVFDAYLNLYIVDSTAQRIFLLQRGGVLTTFAGSGTRGFSNGTGTNATFNNPSGIAIDFDGNLYVADTGNHCIRKITSSGVVTTLAGNIQGYSDGTGINSRFLIPYGITSDSSGMLYVVDSGNNRIRKITPEGVVTTVAGNETALFANGTGTAASFNTPQGITMDSSGVLYVADTLNNTIRRIT
jgi:sugar lactone lactonase YvrE